MPDSRRPRAKRRALPKYCPHCANELQVSDRHGRPRPTCDRCGYVHFAQPKLAVAMLASSNGGLLLVQRGIEPKKGLWTFPSGYVDLGETPAEAAARETLEETGAVVEVAGLVGVYAERDDPVVLVVYHGAVTGGEVQALDETQAVRFFEPDSLPSLAFPHDTQIVQDWVAARDGRGP